jgi:hypothetical protein
VIALSSLGYHKQGRFRVPDLDRCSCGVVEVASGAKRRVAITIHRAEPARQ